MNARLFGEDIDLGAESFRSQEDMEALGWEIAQERRYEAKAADILVELQRMRNARIRRDREPSQAHAALGDYYRAMGRVVDMLDSFRIDRVAVPSFVMEQWNAERRA